MRLIAVTVVALVSVSPVASQTLRNLQTSDKAGGTVAVYADGNLKNALGQEAVTTLASASLGLAIGFARLSVDLLINTIGTASPLEKGFGTTLLAPASGASLAAGLIDIRWFSSKDPSAQITTAGIRGYGSISSARWQVQASPAPAIGAVVGGIGLGGFVALGGHVSGDDARRNSAVVALLDIGVAVRGVGGDIASPPNREQYAQAFGGNTLRIGLELGLQLAVNGAKAGLTYYYFGGSVSGLSRGQVVAGISVQSALFEGALKPGK
ncbi:MAG: hypothetical protein HOP28_07435 [Gemmatimonadales bacterium]|nr:hypothetical protein [Gemmatimonadales bacterium]